MDFAILDPEKNLRAFIECDGKEFHNSEQQKENDRHKDAAAKRSGIRLFRFSGRRIFINSERCAKEVWAEIFGTTWEVVGKM